MSEQTNKRKPRGEIKYKISLNEEQKRVKEDIFNGEIVVINSKAGSGKTACVAMSVLDLLFKKEIKSIYVSRPTIEVGAKLGFLPGAQPYYSKILTPNGWTTMGEIKEGDEVFAFDGTVTKVIGTYEHGIRPTYKITTLQGKEAVTCDKHLWEVQESNYKNKKNKPSIVNTEYIKNNIFNKYGGYKIVLPEHKAVEFEERKITLDPYLIGVLLGDGCVSKEHISFTSVDSDIIDRVREITESYDMELSTNDNTINYTFKSFSENNKPAKTLIVRDIDGKTTEYSRIGEFIKQFPEFNRGSVHAASKTGREYKGKFFQFLNDADFSTNFIKNELNKIGLIGKKSTEKFIPDVYKYNTYENRLNLLQGLLDTDGGIKKNGNVYFTTTSQLLRDDIIELIQSLGGRAVYYERDRRGKKSKYEGKYIKTKHISYEVNISFREFPDIFHLRRKKERLLKNSNLHKDRVKSVEYVGEEKVKCIKIEHPSQLYITDNYIVTHNTADEKINPYLDAFKEALFDCYNDKEKITKHLQNGDIQGEAIQFIRGKNFGAGEILVVDEIQNASVSEVYAILTRLAKGGRIVLIGDIDQVDTRESYTGLHYVIDMAKKIPDIKLHSLKQNHRSDLVAKIIDYEYARKKQ